jgi:hypothetical protein
MRLPIGSVLILFSCWLTLQTVCAQESVKTTVPGNFPIEPIPAPSFNNSSAIHEQEDRFKAEGAMLDYGVNVSTQCKTYLSDSQTRLSQAIAANSFEAARNIIAVSEQTVAKAQAIDAQVFRFANHDNSPAGRAHNAADANLAAAKQTLVAMHTAVLPLATKVLNAAKQEQDAQDDKLQAMALDRKSKAVAWDNRITGGLGELSACFPGDAPPSGVPPSGVNCNVFVGRTLETVYNVPDFKTTADQYLLANQIADFLVTSPKWTLIGSADSQSVLDQAANSASSVAVVAVWRNPTSGEHGHVALIGPGLLEISGKWLLMVPNSAAFSMDDVNGRYIGAKLSQAFGSEKKSDIRIYARLNP